MFFKLLETIFTSAFKSSVLIAVPLTPTNISLLLGFRNASIVFPSYILLYPSMLSNALSLYDDFDALKNAFSEGCPPTIRSTIDLTRLLLIYIYNIVKKYIIIIYKCQKIKFGKQLGEKQI